MALDCKKEKDFGEWYLELVQKSELMDYSPVQGTMVIRPRAYFIWEQVQAFLDKRFKENGIQNAYFPLFIPESFLKREAEHFQGFAPEVAWVTRGGNEELGEPLAVRPTSETIMYHMFAKWISSHRDLPLKVNQWCNVIRWDTKTLKPFLRTREFLWTEVHTAHATKIEAEEQVKMGIDWYKELFETMLAIPVIQGVKSKAETFPGADYTTGVESLMPDGKALQGGTSHFLGQNFAKIFNIKFKTEAGGEDMPWQVSIGLTTRVIGAVAMVHSDDKGLVLPPRIAPVQIVLVPIYKTEEDRALAFIACNRHKNDLVEAGYRVVFDDRDDKTPGFKFNDWELKGVPVRIELGPRDLAQMGVTIARRDTGAKEFVEDAKIVGFVGDLLETIQSDLFLRAKKFLDEHTTRVDGLSEFQTVLENKKGFVVARWCEDARCEEAIKEETGAEIRLLPFERKPEDFAGKCVYCGQPSKTIAYFAKGY